MEPQLLHIIGIWQKPHVKYQVRIRRDPIFKAKAQDCDKQAALFPVPGKERPDLLIQLISKELPGIHHKVGLVL